MIERNTKSMILERDAAELHLSLDSSHKATQQNVAHLMVNDAQSFYEHLVASGVQIVSAIRDADYGMRTFVLADPDGNRIDVGQDLYVNPATSDARRRRDGALRSLIP